LSLLSFIALALLVLSGLLIDAHRRTWRESLENCQLDDRQRRAHRAQYLRRIRASGTIGLVGALLIVRPLVPREPLWFTLYLLLLVLLCAVLFLLALVDGFAASLRVRQSRRQTESLQAKLEKELQAAQDRSDNSDSSPSDS
jgi:hypothetical protein